MMSFFFSCALDRSTVVLVVTRHQDQHSIAMKTEANSAIFSPPTTPSARPSHQRRVRRFARRLLRPVRRLADILANTDLMAASYLQTLPLPRCIKCMFFASSGVWLEDFPGMAVLSSRYVASVRHSTLARAVVVYVLSFLVESGREF